MHGNQTKPRLAPAAEMGQGQGAKGERGAGETHDADRTDRDDRADRDDRDGGMGRRTESEMVAPGREGREAGSRARTAVRLSTRDRTGEPVVELCVPPRAAPDAGDAGDAGDPGDTGAATLRVVGPGRIERRYLERIAELEHGQRLAAEDGRRLAEEIEAARLLERGSGRLLDRLEERLAESQAMERRLSLALGALGQENARLTGRLTQLEAGSEGPVSGNRSGRRSGRGPGLWRRLGRFLGLS